MVYEQTLAYLLNTAVLILGLIPIVAEQLTNCSQEQKIDIQLLLLAYYRAGPSKSEIGQLSEVAMDRSITVILTIMCSTSLKTTAIAMAASVL